jgi:hypothetical protein
VAIALVFLNFSLVKNMLELTGISIFLLRKLCSDYESARLAFINLPDGNLSKYLLHLFLEITSMSLSVNVAGLPFLSINNIIFSD